MLAVIRPESPADAGAVHAVHHGAFGRDGEARLVDALRESGLAIASLVAVGPDRLLGHALFSGVAIDHESAPITVASLAPIAVLPGFQRQGIGTRLVRAGIDACRAAGSPAIIVVGGPFYARFGFTGGAVAHLASPYAGDAFMGLDLVPGFLASLRGSVRYPAAFADL